MTGCVLFWCSVLYLLGHSRAGALEGPGSRSRCVRSAGLTTEEIAVRFSGSVDYHGTAFGPGQAEDTGRAQIPYQDPPGNELNGTGSKPLCCGCISGSTRDTVAKARGMRADRREFVRGAIPPLGRLGSVNGFVNQNECRARWHWMLLPRFGGTRGGRVGRRWRGVVLSKSRIESLLGSGGVTEGAWTWGESALRGGGGGGLMRSGGNCRDSRGKPTRPGRNGLETDFVELYGGIATGASPSAR